MSNRLVLFALFAVVACKGNEGADAAKNTAAADSAAALASSFAQAAAALAQAQAAASAGAVPGAASAAVVASAAPAASASAAPADAGFSAAVSNELGRLGFSTGTSDLLALGKDRGVLLSGLGRLAGHPTALSAIFNSDKVVSSFSKRPDIQDVCKDPEKMKSMLLFALSSTAARALVADPASLKAFTGSKLGLQLQACPAFKALAAQPKMLATLTKDNASASAVFSNPNFRSELDRLKIRQDPAGKTFSKKALK